MTGHNFVGFAGLFAFMFMAWLVSSNRRILNWRLIGWGVFLQLIFGILVFQVPAGTKFFLFVNRAVLRLLDSASAGTNFVFGRLAVPPGAVDADGQPSLGFILAFQALPQVVFFSALMAVLYFYRVMPLVIRAFAYVFTRLMKISGAESLCAASNIFVGVESALVVRPHLERMTRSELCTVLTAGMATIASNVLGFYVFCLRNSFPNIAGHLVSASILSAPAALVMSKIIMPEDGEPLTMGRAVDPHYERERSVFEAIINGANSGMKLIFGIVALLLAVLGLAALIDVFLAWGGGRVNLLTGWSVDWTLKGMLGYVFAPVMWLTGMPMGDAVQVGRFVGARAIITEIPGYMGIAAMVEQNSLTSVRSAVIGTYALCGFAHIASLAIFTGGISALVPSRMKDLTAVGIRALVAATLACLMTACIAGIFATESSILFGGPG